MVRAVTTVADLLAPLIRHRTTNPGGDEGALARELAKALTARGADSVEVIETPHSDGSPRVSVLARYGTPRLLVNAHLDTVPVNAGWTGDPFEARIVDGRLIGLGAADTKGAIAAALAALDDERPQDVAILFSGDEERSNTCMRDILARGVLRGIERAIVCEPTGCRAGIRHRGIVAFEVTRHGNGGHSSFADERPAPIVDLARLAVACADWGIARRDQGPEGMRGMCLNVAGIDGGVAFNVIPESARLQVSLRPPPGVERQPLRDELGALARRIVPEGELRIFIDQPSFATRDVEAMAALVGAKDTVDLAFWTEAALLSDAGIDAVVYGPGEIAVAHAPDEFVTLAQLDEARATFARIFRTTRERHGTR